MEVVPVTWHWARASDGWLMTFTEGVSPIFMSSLPEYTHSILKQELFVLHTSPQYAAMAWYCHWHRPMHTQWPFDLHCVPRHCQPLMGNEMPLKSTLFPERVRRIENSIRSNETHSVWHIIFHPTSTKLEWAIGIYYSATQWKSCQGRAHGWMNLVNCNQQKEWHFRKPTINEKGCLANLPM